MSQAIIEYFKEYSDTRHREGLLALSESTARCEGQGAGRVAVSHLLLCSSKVLRPFRFASVTGIVPLSRLLESDKA